MPSSGSIREHVARETERRGKLAGLAIGGGVLYLLSGIIIQETFTGAPTVGIVQGITPALSGIAKPAVSPRAQEVKFISHHAFSLIAGSALAAIAVGALTLVLLVLVDATVFRRPQTWAAARPLVLAGGVALAVLSIAHQVVGAIETHNFAVGHDFTKDAVDNALTKGPTNIVTQYLDTFAGLALAVGMIAVVINAMRVGLITRWMSILGIVTALLIFLPIGGATLQVIPSFWLVAMGLLYGGKWPNGTPPAWEAGEARPWPPQGQARERGRAGKSANGKPANGTPALSAAGADVAPAPEPAATTPRSSRRRGRRRRGR